MTEAGTQAVSLRLRIGTLLLSNRWLMAPMAGITQSAFRRLVKGFGAGLVTTEMVSAMGLRLGQPKTLRYLVFHPEERPLAVQIFGYDPEAMAEAAGIAVDAGADALDINMGCPVRKVVRTGAGGALLRDPRLAAKIVRAVRRACQVPVTVKLRAGWSPNRFTAPELLRSLEDCGVDAVVLHARFVTQGFSGRADWSLIARLKEQARVPVIGNGDVAKASDALGMVRETGCDGVMIGRAATHNPWIFKQIIDLGKGFPVTRPTVSARRGLIMRHFHLLCESLGPDRAARLMRGLLLRYTKGLAGGARFRGEITRVTDFESLVKAMDSYFSSLAEYEA